MDTAAEVHSFMLKHQEEQGRPPTMAEIQEHVLSLNHRSSVAYTLDILVGDGRVVETGDPGTACRHRAVLVEGTQAMPPLTLPDTHIVPSFSVEDMDR
ncbi:MAG: hypothetical protein GWN58_25715 [Anaerolineae bacterium]|nr:hypothetical protein [Anaerolineae bacterium]